MIKVFDINKNGKDFVVGDIHGQFDALMRTLDDISFNFSDDRLFSVGDLIDRGEQHKEVVELISEDWFCPVRGNHDQFIIDQFDDERVQLFRYRDHTPQEIHRKLEGQWFADLNNADQAWFYEQLKDLPYLIEVETEKGRVGICHAGLPRYINDWEVLKTQLADRDIREQTIRTRRAPKQNRAIKGIGVTVHGHTCFESTHNIENSFWIDTFDKTGSLTILPLVQLFKDFKNG